MLNNFVRFKCTNGTVLNDVRCGLLIALLHIAEGILFAKKKRTKNHLSLSVMTILGDILE